MVAAPILSTTVAGNLGLLDDAETVMLFDFAEVDGVPPSDRAGTLEDLTEADAGLPPSSSTAWAQPISRTFTSPYAYAAADRAGADSLLTRDVTIQTVVALVKQPTGRSTVIARGEDGSASEYACYGLELITGAGTAFKARMFWQSTAGVEHVDAGAEFTAPVDSFFLLTATRRWVSPTSVVCRYYVGDQMLAEVASAAGDIGGGTTGTTSIGARKVGGVWGGWLDGWLDELKVTGHEMCLEEIRATWRRLAVHQPAGDDLMRDLTPPGAPIARDPSTRIQRLLRFVGQGLGLAESRLEQLEDVLPDRAYGVHLERWERICTLAPGPLDSLDTRRARLLAHLRRKGWTAANLKDALLELLDLAAVDIEILNFSNTFTDAFASIRAERWTADPGASTVGWSVTGGAARVQASATNDIRWTAAVRNAPTMLMPVHRSATAYHAAKATLTALPSDGEAGLYLAHGYTGAHLFFGVRNNGGTYEVVYQRFRGSEAADATPVVVATTSNTAHWFRLRATAGAFLGSADAPYNLEWSTDGVTFTVVSALVWASGWGWLGFYARGADSSLAGALDVRFSEFLARTPRGRRPFCVYAYRDPGLPGDPDMKGGRDLLRRFRHAYVHSSAITSKSVLCDNTASGCDAGPMGGI